MSSNSAVTSGTVGTDYGLFAPNTLHASVNFPAIALQ